MNRIVKTAVLALGLMSMSITTSWADKKEDYQKTYNYLRAIELVQEQKYDEAKTFFQNEINDHKDNGYALAWLAGLLQKQEMYGEALANVNLAMKYLSKKEDMYAYCLGLRASIFQSLDDENKAFDDLCAVIKLFPQKAGSYEKRAEYYIGKKQYDLANVDYVSMTKVESSNPAGYAGSGICLRNLKRYEEAVSQFDYALKLNPKFSRVFAQRGFCYYLMGKYTEAVDDIVKAMSIDGDDLAFTISTSVADSAFEEMDFKLKIEQMMQPNEPYWLYLRGHIRAHQERYAEAIEMFEACNKMRFSTTIINRIAECKEEIGDFEGALEAINEGLISDSTDLRMCTNKASLLDDMGRVKEAIDGYTRVIELNPRWAQGYYGRGWVKEFSGDYDGAIEDYTMSIMVDESDGYNYLSRGRAYYRKGLTDLAKSDFEKVLKLDTIPSEYDYAYYAWFYLGDNDKAIVAMDSALIKDDKGTMYDAACLYSLMENTDKAIEYLSKALEKGYSNFNHIARDQDLDNIRGVDAFKQIVEEYKTKALKRWGVADKPSDNNDVDVVEYELITEEIPFTHEGGVTKVRCRINDLPLHFVLDTGASDVSISTVEATFMLKNGYLNEKDVIGTQTYMTADGNISEGTIINLRNVKFGNLHLDNVRASVSKSQKAPLLLGQSVLQRLGKIEIDNGKNVLKITQKVNK